MRSGTLLLAAKLRVLPLALPLELALANDPVRHRSMRDLVRAVVLVAEDEIHLVDGETLGLGHEEVGPDGSDEHPAGEEEPCAVSERVEDVRESLGDGELNCPEDNVSVLICCA